MYLDLIVALTSKKEMLEMRLHAREEELKELTRQEMVRNSTLDIFNANFLVIIKLKNVREKWIFIAPLRTSFEIERTFLKKLRAVVFGNH